MSNAQQGQFDALYADHWCIGGAQCQNCGKFYEIASRSKQEVTECEYGGKLSREKPIFCPECKSKNMHYDMKYIT
jgi:primosomal protein N'